MKACLDCLYCKMIERRTCLKCAAQHWVKGDGAPRMMKLSEGETNEGLMRPRQFFNQAEQCSSFSNMEN